MIHQPSSTESTAIAQFNAAYHNGKASDSTLVGSRAKPNEFHYGTGFNSGHAAIGGGVALSLAAVGLAAWLTKNVDGSSNN